ncbi:hypothetical protein D3C77_378920 [compost metagenome]
MVRSRWNIDRSASRFTRRIDSPRDRLSDRQRAPANRTIVYNIVYKHFSPSHSFCCRSKRSGPPLASPSKDRLHFNTSHNKGTYAMQVIIHSRARYIVLVIYRRCADANIR